MLKKSLVLTLSVFLIFTLSSFRYFSITGYLVGDTVKDFKLKSTTGKMVSLSSYPDAKGAIVVFTCNHCPFAQAYEERIIALHNKYSAKGYPVIAINPNDKTIEPEDSFEEMVKRANQHKYPFEYLYDSTQEVANAFGAARTPHIFVVQKSKSDYIIKYIGAIDDNTDDPQAATKHYVEDAVNSLLAGQDVAVKTTKAIGCTIKWKEAK
jgi:peroxiredoxin